MKKAILILVSLLSSIGHSQSEGFNNKSDLELSTEDADELLNSMAILQKTSFEAGISNYDINIDYKKNLARVKFSNSETESSVVDFAKKIKEILGDRVKVERVPYAEMHYGTQDDIVKP